MSITSAPITLTHDQLTHDQLTHDQLTHDGVREHIATHALVHGPVGTVGLELERHVADVGNPHLRVPWDRLRALVAGFDPPAGSRLTLEPGGQVELSTPPGPLADTVATLERDAAAVDDLFRSDGLVLNSTGLDPLRSPQRVNPSSRYRAMAEHFDAVGHDDDGATMMGSTASLQVNLDAGPQAGWADRLAHVRALTPVFTALAASSPVRQGKPSGLACGRQAVWERLEPGRCRNPGDGRDPVADWTDFALAAPVMFVRARATGEFVPVVLPATFGEWATGRVLLDDRPPTADDVDAHLSTLWPPVRLRGFLELRFLDAVPAAFRPGLAAVVTTAVDDPVAADLAAQACGPVTGRSREAVERGLADAPLRQAARTVLEAVAGRVPPTLTGAVQRWLDLLDSGGSIDDLVLHRFRTAGPAACLLAEELR